MKRAAWTDSARRDLATLDSNDTVYTDYVDRIAHAAFSAARFLADYPLAGPALPSGVRKWIVRGTNYILIYRPVDYGVEVIRFLDARSDWRAAFD